MKNQSIIAISILATGVGLALGYALWGSADEMHKSQNQTSEIAVPAGMHRMPDGSLMGNAPAESGIDMMGSMDHSMMMVKSEREFIEGMIPHHQEAIDTAKEVIARGGSTPEIMQLAKDIIIAQEKEIILMKSWYKAWYGKAYIAKADAYEAMMRDLSSLNGASLDKVFLEDMVMHHMGAVMMAESVKPYIEHPEITALTKAIIETQTAEIELMRQLINDL